MPTFPLVPDRNPAGFGTPEVGQVGRNRSLSFETRAELIRFTEGVTVNPS